MRATAGTATLSSPHDLDRTDTEFYSYDIIIPSASRLNDAKKYQYIVDGVDGSLHGAKTLSMVTTHDTAHGRNLNLFAGNGAFVADEIGAGDEPTTIKTSTKFVLVNNDLYE